MEKVIKQKKRKIYLLRVGFLTNSLQMDHCMNDCWIRYKLVFSSVDCCSIERIDFLSTNTVPLLGDINGSDAKKKNKKKPAGTTQEKGIFRKDLR